MKGFVEDDMLYRGTKIEGSYAALKSGKKIYIPHIPANQLKRFIDVGITLEPSVIDLSTNDCLVVKLEDMVIESIHDKN